MERFNFRQTVFVGAGRRRPTKADYRSRGTSLSTAHRVYFSQIKISQSVLLLAGWCVEVRGGVYGRGWGRHRPRQPSRVVDQRPLTSRTHRHAGLVARESCLISKAPPTTSVGRALSPISLCYLRVNIFIYIYFLYYFVCVVVSDWCSDVVRWFGQKRL